MVSVTERYLFRPPRRSGAIFHLGLGLLLCAAVVAGIWGGISNPPVRLAFWLAALLALGFLPALFYRLYGLWTAAYELEADGIHLRWGWRLEDIPMDSVLWVVPATEFPLSIPLPLLRWPGALQGVQRLSAGQAAGLAPAIEFLASRSQGLVLIGTTEKIFAISPDRPESFLQTYQRLTELGSFNPIPRRSQQPSTLFNRIWANPAARLLLLAGAALSAMFFLAANLATAGRASVRLGFQPDGTPGPAVPAPQLYLLPIINGFFYISNLMIGLFYFRRPEGQPVAFLLWSASLLTSLLLLAGMIWALTNV